VKRHEARNEQALADLEARISEIEKRDAEVRSAEVKIEKRETAVDELKFEVSEDKIEVEAQKKEWGKVRVCEEQSKGPRRRVEEACVLDNDVRYRCCKFLRRI
jgi:hypothetical protein